MGNALMRSEIYVFDKASANPNGDRIEGFTPAAITEKIADQILQEPVTTCAELPVATAASLSTPA